MDQVNKWKAEDSDLSFNAFYGNNFRDAGARPGLVNRDHWERFCLQQGKTFADDVFARDIVAFFNFIRAENVPIDYVELFKVYQD
ncbi:hypothetical protein PC115_g19039 [Phytophthora cactorum]|nr:hypothetical protein PC115_g19039 [Phytophthora cactorum]KAG3169353.1 hypothetical protein C6341_g11110 [Phytophthora cactorum]